MNSGLSQGYALKMLTGNSIVNPPGIGEGGWRGHCVLHLFVPILSELLKSFLKVDQIKERFKSKLVGMVLNGYLSLKR